MASYSKMKVSDLLEASEDLRHLTLDDARKMERRMFSLAKRRLDTIYKHNMYSDAAERYFQADYPEAADSDASRLKVIHKLVALREFLKAQTSTYTGIKKLWAEEEARMFYKPLESRGLKVTSAMKKQLGFQNEEQRRRFWSAYSEFMHQNPRYYDQSTRVQQFIGVSTFWRTRDFNANDINELIGRLDRDITGGIDIRGDVGYTSDL